MLLFEEMIQVTLDVEDGTFFVNINDILNKAAFIMNT